MSHSELKERHLAPATSWGEFIRNQVGGLIHRTDLTIKGLENVEGVKSGAIVVAAPHNGHVDTAIVRMAFDEEFRKVMFAAAAGDYWERIGWKQLANAVTRIIPINRGTNRAQVNYDLEQIAALVLAGERVIIFPEGTRSRDPQTPIAERNFKTGIGVLTLMTEGKVPIIPVLLQGNEKIMPPGSTLPQFQKNGLPFEVIVQIGEPINLSSYVSEPFNEMRGPEISMQRKLITTFVHGYLKMMAQGVENEPPEAKDIEPY